MFIEAGLYVVTGVETILFLQDMIQDIYKLHWNINI